MVFLNFQMGRRIIKLKYRKQFKEGKLYSEYGIRIGAIQIVNSRI